MLKAILSILLLITGVSVADAQQFYFMRYREHATNCKGLTDGGYYDMCRQLSDNNWYSCRPDDGVNGVCDTAGEWKLIVSDSGINLWQTTESGDMRSSDLNANVGIGTGTPLHRLDVKGVINADQDIRVDDDPVCRTSGAGCPAPIFFNPNNYGNVDAWGSGTSYEWKFNAGLINPILTFSSGLVELKQAGLKVYGTTSGIVFGNHMYIRGTDPRQMVWGSTGGTYNNNLIWNNDAANHQWLVTSSNGTTSINFDLIGLKNTSTINTFGAISVGTSGIGANVITATGGISIGTGNFNNVAPLNGVLSQGDVYINDNSKGTVHKKPNGTCCRVTVDNSNVMTCTTITCP